MALRNTFAKRQKERADQYNEEIVSLMEIVQGSTNLEQLQKVEGRLFEMFKKFVDDLDHDRLDKEATESFTLAWNQAIQAVRHREVLVASRGA